LNSSAGNSAAAGRRPRASATDRSGCSGRCHPQSPFRPPTLGTAPIAWRRTAPPLRRSVCASPSRAFAQHIGREIGNSQGASIKAAPAPST
jgi:hypothetical protein